jgi:ketosteroid isomerase-like protein
VTPDGSLPDRLVDQERRFARAFASGDLEEARPLYHPEVIYLSPTVRLFDWPPHIDGVEKTLEFIALTIAGCEDIHYEAVEMADLPDGRSSFVRIHFEWTMGTNRLRSNYVVLYRYRDDVIGRQEIYYDPSSGVEVLSQGA